MDAVRMYVDFLNADVTVFFLPAAYFRYVMAPTDEHRLFTIVAASVVGVGERLFLTTVAEMMIHSPDPVVNPTCGDCAI